MHTGSDIARGGCRALKWMALFGVVFAAGAGSTSAQFTVEAPKMVNEGQTLAVDITVKYRKPPGPMGQLQLDANAESDNSGDVTTIGRIGGLTEAEDDDFMLGTAGNANTLALIYLLESNTETVTRTIERRFFVETWSDLDAEDDQFRLLFNGLNISGVGNLVGQDGQALTAPAAVLIRIEDNEEQMFEWDPPTGDDASPKEGTAAARTLNAVPPPGPEA